MIDLLVKLLFVSCFGLLSFFIFSKKENFIFYLLLVIVIFFRELGVSFSSFNGSLFFNQNSLNFANFKLIDLIVFLIFFFSIFKSKNKNFNNSPIDFPVKLIAIYIILLLCIDYINHQYLDFGSIRRQLNLVMLYFSFTRLLNHSKIIYLNKVLFGMIFLKCLFNFLLYISGFGIESLRGQATIFWDSGLIYGIGVVCVCLFSLIINKNKIIKRRVIIFMFLVVLAVLLFAWRRNIWLCLLIGFIIVIYNAKLMNKIIGFYFLIFTMIFLSIFVNIFPNMPLSKYAKSMNFFNEDIFYDRSNQVHLENVLGYYNLLNENPQMWFFGRRGVIDDDYKNINKWEEYNLGTPHNAIFAKIFNEGIFSVILYMWMHISFFYFCFKKKKILPAFYNTYITGILSFMFAHFMLTLLFIPPETTFKGTFFILFFMLSCINIINHDIKGEHSEGII